jgi:hypothetical protein
VAMTLTASSGNGVAYWSLGNTPDKARFSVNATTGVLSFVVPPNFEKPVDANLDNVYAVQVRVTNGFALDIEDITITVTDVAPEAPPSGLTLSGPQAIRDNATVGSYLGTLTGVGGTQPYTYSKLTDPGGNFAVASNGVVTLATTLVAGTPYSFTARVTDDDNLTFDSAPFNITVTASTAAYANPGGTGDRRSSITVTTPALAFRVGDLTTLLDGVSLSGLDMVVNGTGMRIEFDFGAGNYKHITEITWKQSNTGAHGTWVVEAANDASQPWRQLKAGFTLGGIATQLIPFTDNGFGYRYYRLRQVSGVLSNSPWIYEVEFKISTGNGPAGPQ